ncbi:hypothetical protein D3C73_1444610 [compost metagenome]
MLGLVFYMFIQSRFFRGNLHALYSLKSKLQPVQIIVRGSQTASQHYMTVI